MIAATIIYRDGTVEKKDFPTWPAYAKFIDDHAGTIREADADDMHPKQFRQGRESKNV